MKGILKQQKHPGEEALPNAEDQLLFDAQGDLVTNKDGQVITVNQNKLNKQKHQEAVQRLYDDAYRRQIDYVNR